MEVYHCGFIEREREREIRRVCFCVGVEFGSLWFSRLCFFVNDRTEPLSVIEY